MKPNAYQCAICRGIFETDWDDAEAEAEAQALWGVEQARTHPDMMVICDDCFNRRTPDERRTIGDLYKQRREEA